MSNETPPSPDLPADPARIVAERQLLILEELVQMSLVVCRANAAASIAAGHAVEVILADEYWVPETGRARALAGQKDASEAYQKACRSLRLTLMLEATTADAVRDMRAGVYVRPPAAAARGANPPRLVIGGEDDAAPPRERPEADDEGEAARAERRGGERERQADFEYPERLPRGSYCKIVDDLAADVGAVVDWESATVSAPACERSGEAAPGGGGEVGLPSSDEGSDLSAEARREMALSP